MHLTLPFLTLLTYTTTTSLADLGGLFPEKKYDNVGRGELSISFFSNSDCGIGDHRFTGLAVDYGPQNATPFPAKSFILNRTLHEGEILDFSRKEKDVVDRCSHFSGTVDGARRAGHKCWNWDEPFLCVRLWKHGMEGGEGKVNYG